MRPSRAAMLIRLHRLRTFVRARRSSIHRSLSARGGSRRVVRGLLGRAVRPLVVAVSPLLEVRCQRIVVDLPLIRAHRSLGVARSLRIPVVRSRIPVVHSHIPAVSPLLVVASSRSSIGGPLHLPRRPLGSPHRRLYPIDSQLPGRGSVLLDVGSRLDDVHRARIAVGSSTIGVGSPSLATSGKELDTLRLRLELDRRRLTPFELVDPPTGMSLGTVHSYECLDGCYNRPHWHAQN